MAQTEATKNRLDALAIVAVAATSLAITVGGYVINQHGVRLDRKDSRITTLEIGVATINEHLKSSDRNDDYWGQQTVDSEQRHWEAERRLDKLESQPPAFSGSAEKQLGLMILEFQRQQSEPK